MIALLRSTRVQHLFLIAVPLAVCLAFVIPTTVSAHAILLHSNPAQDAVLKTAPQQVLMWFSENLNPAFSTATVVNEENKRVDKQDAHVFPADPREMDVSLQPNLPPAAYVVTWRTDSADDGHIMEGSFIFYIAPPDASVSSLNRGMKLDMKGLGGNNPTDMSTSRLDAPTLFNFIIITLVELGAIFWVGGQFWLIFVLRRSTKDHKEQKAINQHVQQHFDLRISFPILLMLLIANIGILVGQALLLKGSLWSTDRLQTFLLLATNGRFGIFWIMREVIITLALMLVLYPLWFKLRSPIVNTLLPWMYLAQGLLLFFATAMSSHAAAVSSNNMVSAVVLDWLHLLAAALWVGGMMFIATTYLPILRSHRSVEQASALITTLPYYSPLALAGVGIMAVTGPLSATFHLSSWGQLMTTTYGQVLVIKVLLVGVLLVTSAFHVLLLRPRLKQEYGKYTSAVELLQIQTERFQVQQAARVSAEGEPKRKRKGSAQQKKTEKAVSKRSVKRLTHEVELCEGQLAKKTYRLTSILRWEPLLGVGVLICVGLMNVFAGSLSPMSMPLQRQAQIQATTKPFTTTARTSDTKFTVTLSVNPNRFGTNVFTVSVVDNSTSKPTNDVGVSLYVSMLDMDMGTTTVNLLSDGKDQFSAQGDLSKAGDWKIRIQIRTLDNTLHEAVVTLHTQL